MPLLRTPVKEEPAPFTKGRGLTPKHPFDKAYRLLKAEPKQWMKVADNMHSSEVSKLRGEFMDVEFASRGTAKDAKGQTKYSVWARYMGHDFMVEQLRKANERKNKKKGASS